MLLTRFLNIYNLPTYIPTYVRVQYTRCIPNTYATHYGLFKGGSEWVVQQDIG